MSRRRRARREAKVIGRAGGEAMWNFYVTYNGSRKITGHHIDAAGMPTLFTDADTDEGPTDLAATPQGHFLYAEAGGAGSSHAELSIRLGRSRGRLWGDPLAAYGEVLVAADTRASAALLPGLPSYEASSTRNASKRRVHSDDSHDQHPARRSPSMSLHPLRLGASDGTSVDSVRLRSAAWPTDALSVQWGWYVADTVIGDRT